VVVGRAATAEVEALWDWDASSSTYCCRLRLSLSFNSAPLLFFLAFPSFYSSTWVFLFFLNFYISLSQIHFGRRRE
jgi:hypothetical protein